MGTTRQTLRLLELLSEDVKFLSITSYHVFFDFWFRS